jgi:hypothetical protein
MEAVLTKVALCRILTREAVGVGALHTRVSVGEVDRPPVLQVAVVRVRGADSVPSEVSAAAHRALRTTGAAALETRRVAGLASPGRVEEEAGLAHAGVGRHEIVVVDVVACW